MPIETQDDLELFFDTDDFGSEVTATIDGQSVVFNAIFTDAHEGTSPGVRPTISVTTPRIICRREDTENLVKDTPILVNGVQYLSKDKQHRGLITTVYLKVQG